MKKSMLFFGGSHVAAPEWILYVLSFCFFAATLYYIWRIFNSDKVRATTDGIYDYENDTVHLLGNLSAAFLLLPYTSLLSPLWWIALLAVAFAWLILRAFFWGRSIAWNKQWYDFAHAAMCAFTALAWFNCTAPYGQVIQVVCILYWTWVVWYELDEIYKNRNNQFNWITFGSNYSHALLGIVLLISSIFPNLLNPHMTYCLIGN